VEERPFEGRVKAEALTPFRARGKFIPRLTTAADSPVEERPFRAASWRRL
jgi:hypothetical protein